LPRVDHGEEPRLQAQVVPLSRVDAVPLPSAAPASAPTAPATPAANDEENAEAKAARIAGHEARFFAQLAEVAAHHG
jgi:hypothetical protein